MRESDPSKLHRRETPVQIRRMGFLLAVDVTAGSSARSLNLHRTMKPTQILEHSVRRVGAQPDSCSEFVKAALIVNTEAGKKDREMPRRGKNNVAQGKA